MGMNQMMQFLREDHGASAIDWAALCAGVLSLGATVVSDVYGAAVILLS